MRKKKKKFFIIAAGILAVLIMLIAGVKVYKMLRGPVVPDGRCKHRDGCEFMEAKKPVLYFYPVNDNSRITASIDFDGSLTAIYPAFDSSKENTWEFTADRDGTIKMGGNEYGYLFWEGKSNKDFTIDTGYCVESGDLIPFLEEKLSELGLNDLEKDDFITFWLPKMNQNKYIIISFDTAVYTDVSKLKIDPVPDTLIRVFMTYRGSDEPVDIREPQETDTPQRNGFTVVEWGGSEIQ